MQSPADSGNSGGGVCGGLGGAGGAGGDDGSASTVNLLKGISAAELDAIQLEGFAIVARNWLVVPVFVPM